MVWNEARSDWGDSVAVLCAWDQQNPRVAFPHSPVSMAQALLKEVTVASEVETAPPALTK